MHVQPRYEPEQGGRSLAEPQRSPAPLWLLFAMTLAAGAGSVLFAVTSAERGWLPVSDDVTLQELWAGEARQASR